MQSDGNSFRAIKCSDNSQGKCHFEGFALILEIHFRGPIEGFFGIQCRREILYVSKVKNWYFRSALVRYLLAKLPMKPLSQRAKNSSIGSRKYISN